MPTINCTHRGAAAQLPENTIAAFKRGLEQGAQAIELDVRLCKTGEVVVVHDETLARVANLTTKIADQTFEQLHVLDLGFGQHIETLASLLHALAFSRISSTEPYILIDLKGDDSSLAIMTSVVLADICQTSSYQLADFALISTSWRQWLQLRRLKLNGLLLQTGISFGKRTPRFLQKHGIILIAKFCKANMINPELTMTTAWLVRAAQSANLAVNVWSVNEAPEMKRLITLGVNRVMTDFPDILTGVLKKNL